MRSSVPTADGCDDRKVEETLEDVRTRDAQRVDLEMAGGLDAGRAMIRGNMTTPKPSPYIKPEKEGQVITVDPVATPDTES